MTAVDETVQDIRDEIRQAKTSFVIPVTCKMCIFFKSHEIYGKPCSQFGIISSSDPCKKFTPDINVIDVYGDNLARQMVDLMGQVKLSELPLLSFLALSEKRNRRFGYHGGQIVYIEMFGGGYLNNYLKAKVVSSTKQFVFVRGKDGFTASIQHSSVITRDRFLEISAKLVKQGKLTDPKTKDYYTIKKVPTIDYEPPTIDSTFSQKEEQDKKRKKKVQKAGTVRVR
jgi:hypothetical protein